MLKRPLLAWLFLLSLALVLGGCALSPQKLSPKPQLDPDNLRLMTQGQAVRLVVLDARAQQTIGSRGGLYGSTSNLSVPSNDILPKIKTQVDRGLRLMGFIPSEDSNAPKLTVTISMIDYEAVRTGINAESVVRASFSAEAENLGRRYKGLYTATLTRAFPNSPDKRANNQLLTQVMSDALDRMFADQGMVQQLLAK